MVEMLCGHYRLHQETGLAQKVVFNLGLRVNHIKWNKLKKRGELQRTPHDQNLALYSASYCLSFYLIKDMHIIK